MTTISMFIKKYRITFASFLILLLSIIIYGFIVKYKELSSDIDFFNTLRDNPYHIINGQYKSYLPLAGWPPFQGFYLILSNIFVYPYLKYRLLFLTTYVIGIYFFERKYHNITSYIPFVSILLGIIPILGLTIIVFPQEDILFSLIILLSNYYYSNKNYFVVSICLILGFLFAKIFTVFLCGIYTVDYFAKHKKVNLFLIYPILVLVLNTIYHKYYFNTFIFDIGDKTPEFFNNSTSITSLLYWGFGIITVKYSSILFLISISIFIILYAFNYLKITSSEFFLIFFYIFFATYFYYSPEYFVWLIFPTLHYSITQKNKIILYMYSVIVLVSFSFNVLRGLYVITPERRSILNQILPIEFNQKNLFYLVIISILITNIFIWLILFSFFKKKIKSSR